MDFKGLLRQRSASPDRRRQEVKQAFRKMARKYHRDVNPGDKSAKGAQGNQRGYEVIGDPDKPQEIRRAWLELEDVRAGAARRRRPPGGVRPSQWNANVGGGRAGGPGSYRTMTPTRCAISSERGFTFSIFSRFFRAAASRRCAVAVACGISRAAGPRKGRELEHPLDLRWKISSKAHAASVGAADGQSRNVDVRIPAGVG